MLIFFFIKIIKKTIKNKNRSRYPDVGADGGSTTAPKPWSEGSRSGSVVLSMSLLKLTHEADEDAEGGHPGGHQLLTQPAGVLYQGLNILPKTNNNTN